MPRLNRGMSAAAHRSRRGHPRARPRCWPRTRACSWRAARARSPTRPRAGTTRAIARAARASRRRASSAPRTRVVLGDNLRFAGRLAEAVDGAAARGPREPEVRAALAVAGRGPHQGRSRTRRRPPAYEHVLALGARPHRGPAGAGRPGAPRGAAGRRGRALRPDPRASIPPTPGAMTKLGVLRMRGRPRGRGDRALPQGGGARAARTPRRSCTWRARWPRPAVPRRRCPTSSGRSPPGRAPRWP